jgi:hypothetical protein
MSPSKKYTSVKFGLHPNRTLSITLHRKILTNPHQITKALAAIPNNSTHDHFAIMDATRIVSLNHISMAANHALMRGCSYNSGGLSSSRRGPALDTVVCAAGSTNFGSIMKDYAFDETSKAAAAIAVKSGDGDGDDHDGTEGATTTYDVILLGFDVEETEYEQVMKDVAGLNNPVDEEGMISFFERQRSDLDVTAMIKVFKTTKQEVAMQGLERAVLNRVASKFHT